MSARAAEVMGKVLADVHARGVRLWADEGQLRYEAPPGALTALDIAWLRSNRAEVVATLTDRTRAPLAYSQRAHTNLYGVGERARYRQVTTATQIRGKLNTELVRESLAYLVERHDALRTRIVTGPQGLEQRILAKDRCPLEFVDLRAASLRDRAVEIQRQIQSHILSPIDVAHDPLAAVRMLRIEDDAHVLVLSIEHIATDMFSMGVLFRELLTLWSQASGGRPMSLPEVSVQFPELARRQRAEERSWLARHQGYWQEQLLRSPEIRFPSRPSASEEGWGIVTVPIDGASCPSGAFSRRVNARRSS